MLIDKNVFLLFLIFLNINLFGQTLQFKLVLKDGSYQGLVTPDFFDSLVIYPSSNPENTLFNATGTLYNAQKGNFDFGIVPNNIDTTSELLIKVSFGWYPLTNLSLIGDSLKFSMDWNYRQKPSKRDLEILEKTNELLGDESHWNRKDDRECQDDEDNKKWSLYCALYRASIEVFGDFNHRNPALEVVRTTIQEITPKKEYRHRLMDFNNQNSFEEIERLLSRSIEKMKLELRETK